MEAGGRRPCSEKAEDGRSGREPGARRGLGLPGRLQEEPTLRHASERCFQLPRWRASLWQETRTDVLTVHAPLGPGDTHAAFAPVNPGGQARPPGTAHAGLASKAFGRLFAAFSGGRWARVHRPFSPSPSLAPPTLPLPWAVGWALASLPLSPWVGSHSRATVLSEDIPVSGSPREETTSSDLFAKRSGCRAPLSLVR